MLWTTTRKWLCLILLAVLVLAGSLWIARQIEIDKCLDRGGRWDFHKEACAGSSGSVAADEIAALISQNVPAGSPLSLVVGFLNSQQIENSGYLGEQRKVYAIVRNSSAGRFIHGAVQIEFDFDPDQTLKGYSVREVFTGP